MNENPKKYIEHYQNMISMLKKLDAETKGEYKIIIDNRVRYQEIQILKIQNKYRKILERRYRDIFRELEKTIADRKIHPVEKSYTNYLLNEGVDKICKKVGEEASETIIAAKNDNKEELVGEISDLLFHTFVLMNDRGVSLEDIQNKLKERHQVTGNKKEFHTRGDY